MNIKQNNYENKILIMEREEEDCNHDFEHITFREVQCIHCDKIIYA